MINKLFLKLKNLNLNFGLQEQSQSQFKPPIVHGVLKFIFQLDAHKILFKQQDVNRKNRIIKYFLIRDYQLVEGITQKPPYALVKGKRVELRVMWFYEVLYYRVRRIWRKQYWFLKTYFHRWVKKFLGRRSFFYLFYLCLGYISFFLPLRFILSWFIYFIILLIRSILYLLYLLFYRISKNLKRKKRFVFFRSFCILLSSIFVVIDLIILKLIKYKRWLFKLLTSFFIYYFTHTFARSLWRLLELWDDNKGDYKDRYTLYMWRLKLWRDVKKEHCYSQYLYFYYMYYYPIFVRKFYKSYRWSDRYHFVSYLKVLYYKWSAGFRIYSLVFKSKLKILRAFFFLNFLYYRKVLFPLLRTYSKYVLYFVFLYLNGLFVVGIINLCFLMLLNLFLVYFIIFLDPAFRRKTSLKYSYKFKNV